VFAVEGMMPHGSFISTASGTFSYCELPNLRKLNLKGAVFAVEGMTSENTSIYSGMGTFANSSLNSLETLDLSTTIFAATNMVGTGIIYTALQTFGADMPNLTKLIFSKGKRHVVFAAPYMNSDGKEIKTGYSTFLNSDFSSIYKKEIVGTADFRAEGMCEDNVDGTKSQYDTFSNTKFKTEYTPLPINDDYFTIDEEDIEGKPSKVIKSMNEINQNDQDIVNYNALDFSTLKEQYYVFADFVFPKSIKN
jgi:hypothetical protein